MPRARSPRTRTRGFTLAESAISLVIVSVMMCGALTAVATAARGGRLEADRQRGLQLAEQLMAEILSKGYSEPDSTVATLGPLPAEAIGNRSLFDDVDDYHDWKEPQSTEDVGLEYADGTPIPQTQGWERNVDVFHVSKANLNVNCGVDQGLKRILVEVRHNGREVARLVTLAGKGRG